MITALENIIDLRELEGDFLKLRKSVRAKIPTAVFGIGLSERTHISQGLDMPFVFVCKDRAQGQEFYQNFCEYMGEGVVCLFEQDDMLIHRQALATSGTLERYKALYALASGKAKGVVTTVEALMQYFPSKKFLLSKSVELKIGSEFELPLLTQQLASMGYIRCDTCSNKGEFSLSGDILSVYSSNNQDPLRISFWDTQVESIKSFDIDSLRSIDSLDSIVILPNSELGIEDSAILNCFKRAEKESERLGDFARLRAKEILSEIQTRIESNGVDINWLMAFNIDNRVGIEEYLLKDSVVIWNDPHAIETQSKMIYSDFQNRYSALLTQGETLESHKNLIKKFEKCVKNLYGFSQLAFSSITSSNSIFSPKCAYSIKSTPITPYYFNITALYTDLKNFINSKYKVILCCGDEHTSRSLQSSLKDENIYSSYTLNPSSNVSCVQITPIKLSKGFIYHQPKVVVIGRDDLLRKKEQRKTSKRSKNVFTMPKQGDYVVHEIHGIGLCAGVERMSAGGAEKDYVIINYHGNDKLYVPIDQMDRLSRYSGNDKEPKLNKIGGQEFQKVKAKVKESVKVMAFDLLELYTARQQSKGHKYNEDTVWQKEFEEAFEFTETDDQLRAIVEIKSDMERGIVMDRLLCGDVGYGKTEVALRAIFKTVIEGKQAAILAPTTILARQHYNLALARFNDVKFKCVLLSRFQSKEEIKRNIEMIKAGKADVIIATHRLLSQDVIFSDLGLLVLDEEQRFGVEHKEKLKLIQNNVNVLTLSATPIPRTLNMALTGVRDISVLETPPKERLPIQTYVMEMTDSLLKSAIEKEIERGGQVYVLFNRVQGIEGVAEKIREFVPESRVIVGHGQMQDRQLEDAINSFYNKEGNVLVCTTIIENGIDLPDANTLIVYEADKLGLSALYQLRGRVGRSNKLAYAYFTTKQGQVLTQDATKRLTAIMDYTDFGSGFKIAMRDLEIRGAGNVLGKEQHGHIMKVGYDMYCKLLAEAVEELGGFNTKSLSNVEMQVDIDSYLDSHYISDNNEKIKIYKQIAELTSEAEKQDLISVMNESYGEPSKAFVNLMSISVLKNMAGKIGAKKIIINNKGAGIVFDANVYKNVGVINAVSEMSNDCVLSITGTPTLVFNSQIGAIEDKMDLVAKFLIKSCKSCD